MANTKDKDTTATRTFDYAIAKNVLSDTEKLRCLCLFLNSDHSNINWAKATEDFECKSVDSMKVMTRATLKKITDAEKNGGTLPSASSKGGKKRKAAAGDEGEGGATPVKKGKGGGGKKKKADTPVEEEEDVKQEAGDDDDEL